MNAQPYFSILICDRPGVIELYANGLKLGDVKQGVFTDDPLMEKRNPFQNRQQLAIYLREIANHLSPPVRLEMCTRCMKMVSDWVDPDWAGGRICRECEEQHAPQNLPS